MSTAVDLRREVDEIATRFHVLYYNMFGWGDHAFNWNQWRGVPVRKPPEDLWRYQQIIFATRPDFIVECGVAYGGSTLWFADVCEIMGHGQVVATDVALGGVSDLVRTHPRVSLIEGDSTSREIFEKVQALVADGKRVMVSLDSDHHAPHVLTEMRLYGTLVSVGCYMVVEDSNVNGHPVFPAHGPGPYEAIEEFLQTEHGSWRMDREIERSLLTFNPGGFLVKVA